MSKSLVVWTLGAIVVGALLLFGFRDGADAATWKLVNTVALDCKGGDNTASNADDSCATGTEKALSSTPDLDSQFLVEVGHTNYNKVDTLVASPAFNVALDSSIPNGAAVGNLVTTATLSLLNGPCVSPIPVAIPLFDATTDVTNTIDWVGDGSNWITDSDGNGLSDAIDKYPQALNKVYNTQRPLARYFGYTTVQPGAPPSQLNMMVFASGEVQGTTNPGLPKPEQEINSSAGYVTMIQLDNPDPTAPATVSSITDFCAPLNVTARLWGKTQGEGRSIPATGNAELSANCTGAQRGLDNDADTIPDDGCIVVTDTCLDGIDNDGDTRVNEYCPNGTGLSAARVRVSNPSSATSGIYGTGTHVVGAYSQGNRDADADGIENNLDSCPTTADGRESGAACAPGNVADEDGDGAVNDGCPRIGAAENFPSPNQCSAAADEDGDGLANDGCPAIQVDLNGNGLGDACETGPNCTPADSDCDNDGFDNRQDNCPTTANADQLDTDTNRCNDATNDDGADDTRANDGCPAVGAAETACTDTTDNDGDTKVNDGCPLRGGISEFCTAGDFGACGDAIGNACDANPLAADGDFDKDFPRSALCIGAADADSDGWCDATETALGSNTASATSVPEYFGLEYPMTSGAPGNCNNMLWYAGAGDPIGDGAAIDDDGDTLANAADAGCALPGAGDTDSDGVVNASDNCSTVYNPDQLNSDTIAFGGGDALGDACDLNDDGDGLTDDKEWARGSDAKNPLSPFFLDLDGSTTISGGDSLALKAWINTAVGSLSIPSQVCLP